MTLQNVFLPSYLSLFLPTFRLIFSFPSFFPTSIVPSIRPTICPFFPPSSFLFPTHPSFSPQLPFFPFLCLSTQTLFLYPSSLPASLPSLCVFHAEIRRNHVDGLRLVMTATLGIFFIVIFFHVGFCELLRRLRLRPPHKHLGSLMLCSLWDAAARNVLLCLHSPSTWRTTRWCHFTAFVSIAASRLSAHSEITYTHAHTHTGVHTHLLGFISQHIGSSVCHLCQWSPSFGLHCEGMKLFLALSSA